jgi:type I restriction enzyme R subunit
MSKPLKISEAGTVQFPMVKHAAEIGWTHFAKDGSLLFSDDGNGVIYRVVHRAD